MSERNWPWQARWAGQVDAGDQLQRRLHAAVRGQQQASLPARPVDLPHLGQRPRQVRARDQGQPPRIGRPPARRLRAQNVADGTTQVSAGCSPGQGTRCSRPEGTITSGSPSPTPSGVTSARRRAAR